MTSSLCRPDTTVVDFGMAKTAALLEKAADAIHDSAKSPHAEAIHKMRVSIRRFQQSIGLFRQFFPKKGVRSVKAELKSIMEPAGELRNLDIAMQLVRRNGGHTDEITERRVTARLALQGQLSDMAAADLAGRWRKELKIPDEKNLEA